MKRLFGALAALTMLIGGSAARPPAAAAVAAECCWLYCESYRDFCHFTLREDRDLCDAYYQGCIDGCNYPGGPTSGGGFGGGGGGSF